jgi:hypothetical protein
MSPIPRIRLAIHMCWILAGAVIGLGNAGMAQGPSPVRQLGQSSPGFLPDYLLESQKLKRDQQPLPVFIDDRPGVTPNYDTPFPWWEAAESVALESANPKRFSFGISFQAGWEHDDNPFLTSSDAQVAASQPATETGGANSFYARLPISLTYEGGRFSVVASYNPEYRTYDTEDIDDAFNQSASLSVLYSTGKLGLAYTTSFTDTDGGNVEVGGRVQSKNLATALSATYALSPKTTLGASIAFNDNIYEEFINNQGYSAQGYVDYEFTPKTRLGLGVGYDKSEVELGSGSDALNLSGRFSWQATQKFSLRTVIGCEWRRFEDTTVAVPVTTTTTAADGTQVTTTTVSNNKASGNSEVAPIFSLGAAYSISDLTSISLDAYRRSNPSISEINQNYYSTGVVFGVTQKVYDRFNLSLNTGYENADYQGSVEGVVTARTDDYWFIGVAASCTIMKDLSLEIHYQYGRNESTGGDGLSFGRNLYGASLSYSF